MENIICVHRIIGKYRIFLLSRGLKSKESIRIMCRVNRIRKNKLAVKITLFSRGLKGKLITSYWFRLFVE